VWSLDGGEGVTGGVLQFSLAVEAVAFVSDADGPYATILFNRGETATGDFVCRSYSASAQ
jgi:hypothetical protein